jgi:hypothetical protein
MSSLEEASEILGCNADRGIWLSTHYPLWPWCLGTLPGSIFDLLVVAAVIPIALLVVAVRRRRPRNVPWNDYRGPVFCVLTSDEVVFLSAVSSLFPRKPLSAILLRRPRSALVECGCEVANSSRVTFRFDNGFCAELYIADSSDSFDSFRSEALRHHDQMVS